MGFPYESASWDVVDGAMFIGAGGAAPGLYTFVAAVICVVVLWKVINQSMIVTPKLKSKV